MDYLLFWLIIAPIGVALWGLSLALLMLLGKELIDFFKIKRY